MTESEILIRFLMKIQKHHSETQSTTFHKKQPKSLLEPTTLLMKCDIMIFESESLIFKNRSVFNIKYIPEKILHRDDQIKEVAQRLQWILQGSKPKDFIIYGFGGTGKTLTTLYVVDELRKLADFQYFYINLKKARTEVRALNTILDKLIKKTRNTASPSNLFRMIFDYIETIPQQHIFFILDEIDKIETGYDGLLYCFLRPHEVSETTKDITLIACSNDMNFPRELDVGTRSSFACMDKLMFPRYDANQLKDILKQRAQEGLKEGACEDKILSLCAAHGAQEHGDARKTIELLEKAAEIAMGDKQSKILEIHLNRAREQIEYEAVYKGLTLLPTQCKAVALACIKDQKKKKNGNDDSTTKTIYIEYKNICDSRGLKILTQRRVSDILNDLSYLGMINGTITFNIQSKGKKKVVEIIISSEKAEKIITDDEMFEMFRPVVVQKKLF